MRYTRTGPGILLQKPMPRCEHSIFRNALHSTVFFAPARTNNSPALNPTKYFFSLGRSDDNAEN